MGGSRDELVCVEGIGPKLADTLSFQTQLRFRHLPPIADFLGLGFSGPHQLEKRGARYAPVEAGLAGVEYPRKTVQHPEAPAAIGVDSPLDVGAPLLR